MSSLKRWKKLGGGGFTKWETVNQTVEGIWQGQDEGKFGPMGTVKTESGSVRFPLHTALLNQVEDLPEGKEIKIVYKGKQHNSNTGREFKAFEVYVAEEEPVTQEGTPDEVPF